jgi:hypothetical protein
MEISRRMQRFLREGKLSSSPGTRGVDTENPDEASSPGKQSLLGHASSPSSEAVDISPPGPVISEPSNPSTSTSFDRDLPSSITTDNSAGGSNHSTTQSLESWQTQVRHLYAILDNFQSEFNSTLEELRAGIPIPSQNTPIEAVYPPTPSQSFGQLAHDWRRIQKTSQTAFLKIRSDLQRLASSTTAVAVEVNSLHTSARNTDSSDNDDDKDGNAAVQPSPSHSLMGFFGPPPSTTESFEPSDPESSRGGQGLGSSFSPYASSSTASASASSDSASLGSQSGLSRVSSFSASAFLNRDDGFTPTLDGYDHDRATLSSDDDAREDNLAMADAAAQEAGAVRPRHHHHHTHHHHHHHRREHLRGEVIIDWQRFHAENCRQHSQFSSCDACLGWRRGFERAGGGGAAAGWV